jgi:DNA-binding GntR family transcriptional regulator
VVHKPAFSAARHYLESAVTRAREQNHPRLPPIKEMAREAGVSHVVLGMVVAELSARGILEARPRRGIRICGLQEQLPAASGDPVTGNVRWQLLRGRLRRDLADGTLGPGQLPSRKELAIRYRVSQKTLRRALRALTDDGVLETAGRACVVPSPVTPSGRHTIVLFVREDGMGEMIAYSSRTTEQFSALEQTCAARNVRLQVVLCGFAGTRIVFDGWESGSLATVFDSNTVLGFMVLQQGLVPEFTAELVTRLVPLQKPVAILIEDYDDLIIPGLPVNRFTRRYAVAPDREAGRAVGDFLIARGHRRVCCWSDGSALRWVRERLEGVRLAFAEAGIPDAVGVYYAWADEYLFDSPRLERLIERVAEMITSLTDDLGVSIPPEHLPGVASSVYLGGLYPEQMRHVLTPLMQCELARNSATAWIGLNDQRAADCMRYLLRNRVRVPGQVSVIGFDDSPSAASRRMSSYNFNGLAAIRRMVDFLIWPDAPLSRAPVGVPIAVKGFVHERATTAVSRDARL